MNITITRMLYDALITAARTGNVVEVLRLRDMIDTSNSVKRFFLYIRWQDLGGRAPTPIELGKGWPVNQTFQLELDRAITRADVNTVLSTNASNPVTIMVTPDRAGNVGWYLIDDYVF